MRGQVSSRYLSSRSRPAPHTNPLPAKSGERELAYCLPQLRGVLFEKIYQTKSEHFDLRCSMVTPTSVTRVPSADGRGLAVKGQRSMAIVDKERIECLGSDGQTYVVIRQVNMIEFRSLSGEVSRQPGMQQFRLSTGGSVNWINDDTFEIVQTDMRLKRLSIARSGPQ